MDVEAQLETRCGCRQWVRTTWPLPPEIIMPLRNPSRETSMEEPAPAVPQMTQARRFELVRHEEPYILSTGWYCRAFYEEV